MSVLHSMIYQVMHRVKNRVKFASYPRWMSKKRIRILYAHMSVCSCSELWLVRQIDATQNWLEGCFINQPSLKLFGTCSQYAYTHHLEAI